MFFICAATLHSTSSFAEESHGVQRAVFVSAVSPVSNVLPGDIAPAGLTTGKALPTLLAQNCTVHSVTGTPATPEINQPPTGRSRRRSSISIRPSPPRTSRWPSILAV